MLAICHIVVMKCMGAAQSLLVYWYQKGMGCPIMYFCFPPKTPIWMLTMANWFRQSFSKCGLVHSFLISFWSKRFVLQCYNFISEAMRWTTEWNTSYQRLFLQVHRPFHTSYKCIWGPYITTLLYPPFEVYTRKIWDSCNSWARMWQTSHGKWSRESGS